MPVTIDKGEALSALNMTPLIDVVFLLLIFFLVATRFAEEEREIDVVLPAASEAKPLIAEPSETIVNVTSQGQYFITGENVDERGLELALARDHARRALPARHQVIIRADQDSKTKHITAVMNICNKLGIRNYTLATKE